MTILLLVLGLIFFIGLVVIHEYGHFIMARRNGVEVEEFGIGFPPKIWKKRIKSDKGDYDFTINALPLGGFVKLKGEHDSDTEKGTFGAASLPAKIKIMLAGVVMNLLIAFLLLTILAFAGLPKLIDNQFTVEGDTRISKKAIIIPAIQPGSPADKAGLKPYDEFASIGPVNGTQTTVRDAESIPELTKRFAGQEAEVQYRRDGELKKVKVQLLTSEEVEASRKTDDPKGYLGIVQPTVYQLQRSTWSSPIVAAGLIKQFTELTFQGLGTSLKGLGSILAGAVTGNTEARQNGQTKASEQVAGPLGIFVVLKSGSNLGIYYVLMIIAVISLGLAIMNVLPIPALDGGRLFLTLISRGVGKPLNAQTEELINGIGFLLLMGLFVLITIVDYKRFF